MNLLDIHPTATQAPPLCSTCGADLDCADPQGNICTHCRKYEGSCTCDPVEVGGPNPHG